MTQKIIVAEHISSTGEKSYNVINSETNVIGRGFNIESAIENYVRALKLEQIQSANFEEFIDKFNEIGYPNTVGIHELKHILLAQYKCEYCKYYMTLDEAKNNEMYKNYPFDAAEKLNKDGLCSNCDKWVFKDDFCSDHKETY